MTAGLSNSLTINYPYAITRFDYFTPFTSPLRQRRAPAPAFQLLPQRNAAAAAPAAFRFDDPYTDEPQRNSCQMRSPPWARPVTLSRPSPALRRQPATAPSLADTAPRSARLSTPSAPPCCSWPSASSSRPSSCSSVSAHQESSPMILAHSSVRPIHSEAACNND